MGPGEAPDRSVAPGWDRGVPDRGVRAARRGGYRFPPRAGALIAADHRLSPSVVAALAAAVGFLHGWLNGTGLVEGQRDALALVGIAAAVFVLVTIAAAFVVSLQAAWVRIAVRVAGSWVAATGLLMLGWWLRGT